MKGAMNNLIAWLAPAKFHKEHRGELSKTQVAITQFKEASVQLRSSIETNGFAKAIILEEGATSHAGLNIKPSHSRTT